MEASFRWFFILLLLSVKFSFSQGIRLEEYHHEDGLPNDLVKSLEIGPNGFVWVATDDGVVKIEGREFVPVAIPEMFSNNFKELCNTQKFGFIASADPGILSIRFENQEWIAEYINDLYPQIDFPKFLYPKTLFEASDSSLWMADLKNIYHFDGKSLRTYDFGEKDFTDHFSRSFQIFEDAMGTIYVISQPGYFYRFNKTTGHFEEIQWDQRGIPVYTVLYENSKLFVGNDNGLHMINVLGSDHLIHSVPLPVNNSVSVIKAIGKNELAIGTWTHGAYKVDLSGAKPRALHIHLTEEMVINDILLDRFNQLWFATNNGVALLRNVPFSNPFADITKKYVQDILLTADNQIYFTDGSTVYKVVGNTNRLEKFYQSEKGLVLKVLNDIDGIWLSTNLGKLIFKGFNGSFKEFDFSKQGRGIYGLEKDRNKNIWFIQDRGIQSLIEITAKGQIRDMTPPEIEGSRIRFLKRSPSGDLYIGSQGKDYYLFKYNEQTDSIENISQRNHVNPDLNLSAIDIAFKNDSLILATKLGLWIQTPDTLFQLPIGDMTNEMVTSVVLDRKGRIWFTNSNGLILFDSPNYTIFNNNEGMPSKTSTYRSLYIDSSDHIWVGTISGMARGDVIYHGTQTPVPVITRLENSGVPVKPYKENHFVQNTLLNFRFASPIYPSRFVNFQYQLSNDSKVSKWKSIPKDALILSDMEPGWYHLKVRSRMSGNYSWSKPTEYTFKIYEVWYMRFWFLMTMYLVIFTIAFLVILYIRWKNENERKKLESIIEERTRVLQEKNEELIMLNREIEETKNEAIAAISSKDRFFSILAHDLKSPFNTLIGFSQLLVYNRDELSEESMSQLLAEMLATSENTYRLLQNLLDWARSQTGALQISPERFVLKELVIDLVRLFESTAMQKDIEISYVMNDEVTVFADVSIVGTLLRNLLSNAIKFSHRGSKVHIEAHIDSGLTKIKIMDSGVGISEARISTLFNIDSANTTKGTADEKGTGLGLVLCKEFVDKSNGTLSVESKLGDGTTFIVTLPS